MNILNYIKISSLVGFSMFMIYASLFAAPPNGLYTGSSPQSGTIAASVSISERMNIRLIDDPVSWGTLNPDPNDSSDFYPISLTDGIGVDQFCVGMNKNSGSFSVTLTSANGSGGDLRLFDGSSEYIVYTINYSAYNTGDVAVSGAVVDGVAISSLKPSNLGGCNVATVATSPVAGNGFVELTYVLPNANVLAAQAGTYTDVITINISPTF